MPRPVCCRKVHGEPPSSFFKPRGIPLSALEVVSMTVDEFEAIRLADLAGLYQEEAAGRMGVSRQTFGRIVESGRRKIAEALVHAKALEIQGGEIKLARPREFQCSDCGQRWRISVVDDQFGRVRAVGLIKRHVNIERAGSSPAKPQGGNS